MSAPINGIIVGERGGTMVAARAFDLKYMIVIQLPGRSLNQSRVNHDNVVERVL